jgi:hypothetical protein
MTLYILSAYRIVNVGSEELVFHEVTQIYKLKSKPAIRNLIHANCSSH